MFAHRVSRGFTLVELLIVVVVLGILAGIVLPSFNSSTEDSKVSAVTQNLSVLRSAVDLYKAQHSDNYPGYGSGGTPDATTFTNQLTMASKKDGTTSAVGTTGYALGPYLKTGIPANPFNGKTTITMVADNAAIPAADDATGWFYKAKTGEVKCNSTFVTADSVAVYSY